MDLLFVCIIAVVLSRSFVTISIGYLGPLEMFVSPLTELTSFVLYFAYSVGNFISAQLTQRLAFTC